MRSKLWMLTRTLLTASGNRNILKYEKDPKKRKKVIGGIVGQVILYAFFAALFILLSYGLGTFGMIRAVPAICALIISVLELIFSILRVGNYLFSRKDYEILMALPFTQKELVSAKFLAMYIHNLPTTVVCSLALMIGYGYYERPSFIVYVIWIVLTVFLPLIPTVIAAAIGVLSAGAGAGSKHKTVVQSVFIFIFTIFFIFIGQIAGQLFSTGEKATQTLTTISDVGASAGNFYLPVRWFSDAITKTDPLSILLLIGVSVALFELVFVLISKAYRRINSRMVSIKTDNKKFTMQPQKIRSVERTIAFKEFRRFLGSTIYLTNMGVGIIIILILSVLVLCIDINWLLSLITRGAPVKADVLIPGIPLLLYFFLGMAPTTVVSWSLEGKNFWILQSLPITKWQICRGKMLFNLMLYAPFMIIGCICFSISLHVEFPIFLLFILVGMILCLFSTFFGMYCNLRHVNMEWDKEVEVVKQGSAVMFYMLPNMFITMGAAAAAFIIGHMIGPVPILLLTAGVYGAVAFLYYRLVRRACADQKAS